MQPSFNHLSLVNVSDMVEDQFPQFYKEHGAGFIEFVRAYYEWMETEGPIKDARSLYKQFDIDTASDEFLSHYKEKYMWGIPDEVLGNQKLLQKHIIQLYRSKGSQSATRLLFRLLFNEDISFYVPSYDIFKLSDNTWVEPKYIEVTPTSKFEQYLYSEIRGEISGATAIVENIETFFTNGTRTNLLYVSSIVGEFLPGESVSAPGVTKTDFPQIVGSVVGLRIIQSSPGLSVGRTMTSMDSESPIQVIISETINGTGSLSFELVNPGSYYTLDATFVEDPPAITGTGASLQIHSLKDTHQILINTDLISGYANIPISGTYPFPKLPTSNISTVIDDSLSNYQLMVGSIDRVLTLNPGSGYSGIVNFRAIDPVTSELSIRDSNGDYVGKNGLVVGRASLGDDIANDVRIISSGYHNLNTQYLFVDDDNELLTMTAEPIIGGVGVGVGYYENTKSFLSDDKYLFDGHYYQDFSYVVQSEVTLDRYVDILKKLVHPSGNAIYGDIKINVENQLFNDAYLLEIGAYSNDVEEITFTGEDNFEYVTAFDDINTTEYTLIVDKE